MNRLYYGDNLDILHNYIGDESVDLIYIDPPFNSNRAYEDESPATQPPDDTFVFEYDDFSQLAQDIAPYRRARIEIPDELPEPVDLYAMMDQILPAGWQPESNHTRTTHRHSRANHSDYPLLDVERYLTHYSDSFQVKNKDGRTIYELSHRSQLDAGYG